MNIIGLGSAGCNLAELFENNTNYNVKLLDVDIEGENCYSLPHFSTPELYESNFPDIKNFFGNLHKQTLFIVGGSGKVSGGSLKLLEQVKNTEISVIYIRPDTDLLGNISIMQDRLTFNVFQEYARSGVFKNIYLISNLNIENILGDVPVIGYYENINNIIFNTVNSVINFSHTQPIISSYSDPKEVSRICTYGIYDIENNIEKMFYPLDNIDDKCYNFVINESMLKTDGKLFKTIKDRMKQKNNETKNSYRIFSSKAEQIYCYITAHSKFIQK